MYFEIIRLLGLVGTVACIISRIDVVGLWPVLFLKKKGKALSNFLKCMLTFNGSYSKLIQVCFLKDKSR